MSAAPSKACSNDITEIPVNIEGISVNKASMLSELCKREHCNCPYQQETHRSSDYTKPKIAGLSLVAECPHNKYGSAVYIRKDLKVNSISVCKQGTVELLQLRCQV